MKRKRLLQRLSPNLETLRRIISENQKLFRQATSTTYPLTVRRGVWRQLVRQRGKAVRLVEEMCLRIQRLDPMLKQLRDLASQASDMSPQERRRLYVGLGETRRTLRRRLRRLKVL